MNVIISFLLCGSVLPAAIAFNSTSLYGKLATQGRPGPKDIKYIVIIVKLGKMQCNGCLLSPRYILSTAGCMSRILKCRFEESKLFGVTAFIARKHFNLKDAVYDKRYRPIRAYNYRFYDVGMALVDGSIPASDNVDYATLSKQFIHDRELNKPTRIVGWSNDNLEWVTLTEMDVKIMDIRKCVIAVGHGIYKPRVQMCGLPIDSRNRYFWSDAGSPLILDNDLVGILCTVKRMSTKPMTILRTSAIITYVEEIKEYWKDS